MVLKIKIKKMQTIVDYQGKAICTDCGTVGTPIIAIEDGTDILHCTNCHVEWEAKLQ